jgi:hypothetical protein
LLGGASRTGGGLELSLLLLLLLCDRVTGTRRGERKVTQAQLAPPLALTPAPTVANTCCCCCGLGSGGA